VMWCWLRDRPTMECVNTEDELDMPGAPHGV
jgi:hypothetical protein